MSFSEFAWNVHYEAASFSMSSARKVNQTAGKRRVNLRCQRVKDFGQNFYFEIAAVARADMAADDGSQIGQCLRRANVAN